MGIYAALSAAQSALRYCIALSDKLHLVEGYVIINMGVVTPPKKKIVSGWEI